jgi:hypothetical protein
MGMERRMEREYLAGAVGPRFSSAVVLDVDAIVALDMAETLAELGVGDVTVLYSPVALAQAAAARRFDLAVLDVTCCAELALALARAATPIIAVGTPPDPGWSARLHGLVLVAKPYQRHQIAGALRRISASVPTARPPLP